MPDISLCFQVKCPVKNKCVRFLAKPQEFYQSYSLPQNLTEDGCHLFWDVKNSSYPLMTLDSAAENAKSVHFGFYKEDASE